MQRRLAMAISAKCKNATRESQCYRTALHYGDDGRWTALRRAVQRYRSASNQAATWPFGPSLVTHLSLVP